MPNYPGAIQICKLGKILIATSGKNPTNKTILLNTNLPTMFFLFEEINLLGQLLIQLVYKYQFTQRAFIKSFVRNL